MKSNFKILLGLSILSSYTAVAQSLIEPKSFTLKQCILYAVDHNPDINKAKLELDRSKYQSREILSGLLIPQYKGIMRIDDNLKLSTQLIPGEIFNQPGTTIPVKFGTQYNITTGFEGNLFLFNGPLILNYKISKKSQQLNEMNIEKTKEDIIYEVAQAYYNIQIINKQHEVIEENIANLDTLIKIAGLQFKIGIIKKIDLDQMSVNRVNLQTQLENIQLSGNQLLGMLKYYMGFSYDQQITLTDSITEYMSILNADRSELQNSVDLLLLEKQKEISLLNIRQIKAGYLPTLSIYENYYYQAQRDQIDFFDRDKKWYPVSVIGLNLNIPILGSFQTSTKVKQAKIQLRQLELTKQNTRHYLDMQNDNTINKVQVNINAIETQRKNMKMAEEVYQVTVLQYQKGITALSGLLNSESLLKEAQTNYLNAIIQLKLAGLDYLKNNGNILTIIN